MKTIPLHRNRAAGVEVREGGPTLALVSLLLLTPAGCPSGRSAEFGVPSADYPTIQAAVEAAALSPERDNVIHLREALFSANAAPQVRDVAVTDHWGQDPRPSGKPLRTDRGADQIATPALPDLRILRPGLARILGRSYGLVEGKELEVNTLGPQEDPPVGPGAETMRGGEFTLRGLFVSLVTGPDFRPAEPGTRIITPQLVGHLEVQLDRLIYATSDVVAASLLVDQGQLLSEQVGLVLVGSQNRDVEVITARRVDEGRRYVTERPVPIGRFEHAASVRAGDHLLVLKPGEVFFAFYFTNPQRDGDPSSGEHIVADFAMLAAERSGTPQPQVWPALALTEDEVQPQPGAKKVGTVTYPGGLPVQIATEELVIRPRNTRQLEQFLAATGGRVVLTDLLQEDQSHRTQPSLYLVRVDPARAKLDLLPQFQVLAGKSRPVLASSVDALRICALALEHRLNGFPVGVNPRLQLMGQPSWQPEAQPFRDDITRDSFRAQPFELPKVWSYLALWDHDTQRIPVAFLDHGFSPNSDFRPARVQCDLEGGSLVEGLLVGFRCQDGAAVSPPTTGASFFGERNWHGNGVVTVAGGIVNNGYGAAGTGGQVIEPMLYRFGTASYALEIGLGIRRAVWDGAAIINISAGYPCRIPTELGVGMDVCDAAGRAAFCLALTGYLMLAVEAVCAEAAVLAAVPFIGPFLAWDAAVQCTVGRIAVHLSGPVCAALIAAGDLRGPMEEAVAFALDQGVPVVSIAGNRLEPEALPELVRGFIDLDNISVDHWQIIPGVIDGVLCVGAVEWIAAGEDGDPPPRWANAEFTGRRVDLWAPVPSRYYGPPTLEAVEPDPQNHTPRRISATSAAAPYVTGLIANLMAINPTLNPLNPALAADQRQAIPGRVRRILVNTAEPLLPDGERSVSPLQAMQTAGAEALPRFARDYDSSLNFSETVPANSHDLPQRAFDLDELAGRARPAEHTGTILFIPGEAPHGVSFTDHDWYRFTLPPISDGWPEGLYQAVILLHTPDTNRWGALSISGDGFREVDPRSAPASANETVREFVSPLLFNGARRSFRVHGEVASDNVYVVSAWVTWAAPPPPGDRFDQDNEANRPESRPNNNPPRRAVHLGADNDEFAWQTRFVGPDPLDSTIRVPDLSFHNLADRDCFKIVNLPPYEFYEAVNCHPDLEVSWDAELQLEVVAPITEEVLVVLGGAPARIPSRFVFEGMILRLRPIEPGEYITYELTLTFRAPPARLCSLAEELGSSGGGQPWDWPNGGEAFGFPRYRSRTTEPAELARFRRGFAEIVRELDGAGRVTTPDFYLLEWRGGDTFRLAVALNSGDSLRLGLLNTQAVELASAWVGNLPLRGPALPARDQLGRPYVLLDVPSLPAGTYVLAVSHGQPGTELEAFLPTGASPATITTIEAFIQDYLRPPVERSPALLPTSPIQLATPPPGSGPVALSFFAQRGVAYRLEFTPSLTQPRWQTLRYLEGDGKPITVTDLPNTEQRFYRLATEP